MTRVIFIGFLSIFLAVPALAYFGGSPFGQSKFDAGEFGAGAMGEGQDDREPYYAIVQFNNVDVQFSGTDVYFSH